MHTARRHLLPLLPAEEAVRGAGVRALQRAGPLAALPRCAHQAYGSGNPVPCRSACCVQASSFSRLPYSPTSMHPSINMRKWLDLKSPSKRRPNRAPHLMLAPIPRQYANAHHQLQGRRRQVGVHALRQRDGPLLPRVPERALRRAPGGRARSHGRRRLALPALLRGRPPGAPGAAPPLRHCLTRV